MAANEIHIGDVGTVFEVTLMDDDVIEPIDGAIEMKIIFVKPDANKTKVTNIAVWSSDGLDGKMRYVISNKDELDIKGTWKIQGIVTFSTGEWHTDIDNFKVHANL